MSEASSAAVSVKPTTSGVWRRAATMTSGSSALITAMDIDPRRILSTARIDSTSVLPVAMCSSMRWTTTSVSVSEVNVCPLASRRSASSAWFSMIPLWMIARRPVQSRWGWAFWVVGRPWVAQRVWPIPVRLAGAAATSVSSSATEWVPTAARTRQMAPGSTTATPAES
jgi:hypothetical protein